MAKQLRLSIAMRQALINLHGGWHFGVDGRTERALLGRGYIYLFEHRFQIDGRTETMQLPDLTDSGESVAAEVYAEELRAAGARAAVGTHLRVIEGGRHA